MKNLILTSLILTSSMAAHAYTTNPGSVLISCFSHSSDSRQLKRVTILDGDDPQHLKATITQQNGQSQDAEAQFLEFIGGTYESLDLTESRDHQIKVSQKTGQNLFMTFKRDVETGSENRGDDTESNSCRPDRVARYAHNVKAWKNGKSIAQLTPAPTYSMRGYYRNQLLDLTCDSGKWAMSLYFDQIGSDRIDDSCSIPGITQADRDAYSKATDDYSHAVFKMMYPDSED